MLGKLRICIISLLLATLWVSCRNYPGERYILGNIEEFEVNDIKVILQHTPQSRFTSAAIFIDGGIVETPEPFSIYLERLAIQTLIQTGPPTTSHRYYHRKMNEWASPIRMEITRDYSMLQAYTLADQFDTVWSYLTSMIGSPQFDTNYFENQRQREISGILALKISPDIFSKRIGEVLFFANHPYGRLGTQEELEDLSIDDLAAHCKRMFVRSRLTISISGSLTKEAVIAKIRSSPLAALPLGTKPRYFHDLPVAVNSPFTAMDQFKRKIPTNYIVCYFIAPSPEDKYYGAFQQLTSYMQYELYRELRVHHPLAYAPIIQYHEGKVSYGSISFQTDSVPLAITSTKQAIYKFQTQLFSPHIQYKGTRGETYAYMQQQSVSGQSIALGKAEILRGSWRRAFEQLERNSKVRPIDIQDAALNYLRNISWVFVGDTTVFSTSKIK